MAYSAAVTWHLETLPSGARRLHLLVVETEAAAASAWSTKNATPVAGVVVSNSVGSVADAPVFRSGRIRSLKAKLVSGAGVTIAPRAGRAAAWADSSMDEVYVTSPAAAFHHETPDVFVSLAAPGGPPASVFDSGTPPVLHGASVVAAAADSVVHTELIIDEVA